MNRTPHDFSRRQFIGSAAVAIAAGSAFGQTTSQPDLIFHHGKIVTVDPQFRIVEAMAVRGDRIVAVGRNERDRTSLAGPTPRQVDLEGKTVLPGLIDSHAHPDMASVYEFDHPVPEHGDHRRRAPLLPSRGRRSFPKGSGSRSSKSSSPGSATSVFRPGRSLTKRRPATPWRSAPAPTPC